MERCDVFLSVIIPVYNPSPDALRGCVESVLRLPESSMEVILVDDGSTDGSGVCCDALATEASKPVRVVHQANAGVSAARNVGLQLAQGTWVWMVDADDAVLEVSTAQWQVYRTALEGKLWAVTGFIWEEAGRKSCFGADAGEIPYNLWRCWFCRDIINELKVRFTIGRRYAEDQEFIWRYRMGIECRGKVPDKTLAMPEVVYHYAIREGSAMTRSNVKGKMVRDISAVLWSGFWRALRLGIGHKPWVLREEKRLLKTLWVTLKR